MSEKEAPKPKKKSGPASGKKKGTGKGKKGKKGKGSKPKGPSLSERIKSVFLWLKLQIRELIESLDSKDSATRRMTYLFFTSIFALFMVLGISLFKYQQYVYWKAHSSPEALNQARLTRLAQKEEEEKKKRQKFMFPIGEVTVELKATKESPNIPGTLNIATIGMVLECDFEATCQNLEGKTDQVRHQITVFLTSVDRLEMLSREGKRKIKKALLERVNAWLTEGKVTAIYFNSLIIN